MNLRDGRNKRINAGSVTTDSDLAYPMAIEVMPLAILIEQQNRIDDEEQALLRLLVELLLAELRRPVRSTTEDRGVDPCVGADPVALIQMGTRAQEAHNTKPCEVYWDDKTRTALSRNCVKR